MAKESIVNRINILKAVGGFAVFSSWSKAGNIAALDLLAHEILNKAKRKCPVRTGALRASGRVETPKPELRIISFGGPGTLVDYAATVEYGGRYPPRPFLRPAFLEVRAKATAGMLKNMKIKWQIASKVGSSI